MKKNVLVFPSGSEIGLEVHRSVCYSSHFKLIGASSTDDHGSFVYGNHISGLPYITEDIFLNRLSKLVQEYSIDAIYPTMDSVATTIKQNEAALGCRVISSPFETLQICQSKRLTYNRLQNVVPTPRVYNSLDEVQSYPIFLKPEIGYGSRGIKKALNRVQVESHLDEHKNCMLLEYLPGKEYTVDCFTDRRGLLRFVGPRERRRITNGISVNTQLSTSRTEVICSLAEMINKSLTFRGAWFFQTKENSAGELSLLEVAGRIAGSSAIHRCRGINLPLLSIFDAFDIDTDFSTNGFYIELDRALENKYRVKIDYSCIYVDLDDCLILDGKVNTYLVSFLYQAVNNSKKLILITKHAKNVTETLNQLRLQNLFDEIIHLRKEDEKCNYITVSDAIFIDDSYSERRKVFEKRNIPVFAPDAVESLLTP